MGSDAVDESSTDNAVAKFASTQPLSNVPSWYPEFLESVSEKVRAGHARTVSAANRELVATYWDIGRDIHDRQASEGWGSKVIVRLSADLRDRFPEGRGFSPRNLKYMRAFAEAWDRRAIVQAPLAQLPWYHQIALLEKLDDADSRRWYATRASDEGWSRNTLVQQIKTMLPDRVGKATTNFKATLPPSSSELVQEATKDPYIFDFLSLTGKRSERDLEAQLMGHVERFLLELGRGFAFVGRQLRLDIAGDEFFPDLLFYNFKLRRFVVVELKATKFEPGYLGQLGMYMSAVDDLLAQPGDEPTIGLLLCKTRNSVVAEYALRGYKPPIGFPERATEWVNSCPPAWPSVYRPSIGSKPSYSYT